MFILKIEHLEKRYEDFNALNDISLTVEKGETVAIIGSSGSGKSTLMRCINNLEVISSGKIEINGDTLVHTENGKVVYASDKEIRRICMKTAMVFQHFNLFPHLTCMENITITPIRILKRNKKEVEKQALKLLDMVGLSDKANNYPSQLSGGQKQRVAIARALAIEPEIMLFDEPTSALDPEITNEVISVIQRLASEHMTMIIVTHDMRFAKNSASRVIYMDKGEFVEENTPEEIFNNPKSLRLKDFLKGCLFLS